MYIKRYDSNWTGYSPCSGSRALLLRVADEYTYTRTIRDVRREETQVVKTIVKIIIFIIIIIATYIIF